MNWATLVLNTGGYPETGYAATAKIAIGLVLILWAGTNLLIRWTRKEKKTSVAQRAGLVKPPKSKSYKKLNGATYRILDVDKYDRFWWGRHPSSRELLEAWLMDPSATMRDVSKRHGKRSTAAISRLVRILKVRGLMVREEKKPRGVA